MKNTDIEFPEKEMITAEELFARTKPALDTQLKRLIKQDADYRTIEQEAYIYLWDKCKKAKTLENQRGVLKVVFPRIKGLAQKIKEYNSAPIDIPSWMRELMRKINKYQYKNGEIINIEDAAKALKTKPQHIETALTLLNANYETIEWNDKDDEHNDSI